ncbi:MAG: NTP transferase domain-containing protein [Armatimonadetes bacterium]|nr:NTP transferase domain-containing protein [Armatimonadota bacterium]
MPPPRITRALVPAAGRGTRMRPLTYACPKELLPLGAKPVLHRLMDELADAGIESVCVITSREKPTLAEYLRQVELPMDLEFVIQEEQRGLGDAILYGQEFAAGEPVLVALGDSLIDSPEEASPLRRMLSLYETTGAGVILGQPVPPERISRYGVMDPARREDLSGESFALRRVVEKPPADKAPSHIAVSARYLLPAEIFEALERTPVSPRGEVELTDALVRLMLEATPMYGLKLRETERRWDIGGFNTYFEAFAAYAARDSLGN